MFQFLVDRHSTLYARIMRIFGLKWSDFPRAANDNRTQWIWIWSSQKFYTLELAEDSHLIS